MVFIRFICFDMIRVFKNKSALFNLISKLINSNHCCKTTKLRKEMKLGKMNKSELNELEMRRER